MESTDQHSILRDVFLKRHQINNNWITPIAAELAAACVIESRSQETGDSVPFRFRFDLSNRIAGYFGDPNMSQYATPIGRALGKVPARLVDEWPMDNFPAYPESHIREVLRDALSRFQIANAQGEISLLLAGPLSKMITEHFTNDDGGNSND